MSKLKYIKTILVLLLKAYLVYLWINFVETFTQLLYYIYVLKVASLEQFGLFLFFLFGVNDTLRMYKNDDIRMYNFNCITDTIVEVITTCNTYTLLTVHLL